MLLNCKGRLLDLHRPVVMGILNVTPDSFHDGGHYNTPEAVLRRAERMLNDGATLLDVGGVSTRPGAAEVSETEELERVIPCIELIARELPDAFVSVDTWRSRVAAEAVAAGACVVNDISGGQFDPEMFATVARLRVPYILMHIQGRPQTMQQAPTYTDVVQEVLDYLIEKVHTLRALGVSDIVLDPGFGFGKSVEHNYTLLRHLHVFEQVTGLPVLAGVSRKSMICKVLGVKPAEALNGTTALHVVALQQGARILRVHDVREAVEVIQLFEYGMRNTN